MQVSYFLLAALAASLVISHVNQRLASPVVAILDRWLRWLIFSFGSALVCRDYGLVDRPFWVLAVSGFVLWFLGETIYNWLAISALSSSPLPLFPRYAPNLSGEEWPIQPHLLKMRDWLRTKGFRQIQALRAEVGGGIFLRASIYQNEAGTLWVQVMFLPQGNGSIAVCYTATSVTADGQRFVTDNLYVPFGGFYPENWSVDRRPCCRSLPRLLRIHERRLARAGKTSVPIATEPIADLNETQRELDRVNTELGFLNPMGEREDNGKITHEGRFRVWKEIWMLNYLGRAAHYR
jgi:hypothetical protein